jgi:hypothetical protein
MALGILAFAIGTISAYVIYRGKVADPILIPPFKNKFYIDEIYAGLIEGSQELLAKVSAFFDKWVVDGVVRVSSGAVWVSGSFFGSSSSGIFRDTHCSSAWCGGADLLHGLQHLVACLISSSLSLSPLRC